MFCVLSEVLFKDCVNNDTMTEICVICLKANVLLKIDENNVGLSDNDIFMKLTNCVPEIEWKGTFYICQFCIKDLNHAYQFKILCITSHASLKKIISSSEAKESVVKLDSDDVSLQENEMGHCHECLECKLKFETQGDLKEHNLSSKTNDKKVSRKQKVSCHYCLKTYTNKHTLEKHLNICKQRLGIMITKVKQLYAVGNKKLEGNTGENIETYISSFSTLTCEKCGTSFRNKYLLKRHMLNVHASEKKYKCELCDRAFVSPVYLNAHKRYHIGERPHVCSFCGKRFITASDLYHHEKIHANKRSYCCEICPKAFNTSSDLHKHRICVHSDRTKWKYPCTYCDKRFPLKTNLDAHIKTHTGEKNFCCHLCDKKCISKFVLTKHIETHTNIINFKCEICFQGYKHKKSLQLHMTKIHGIGNANIPEKIRKFICHICPKSYFANSKLQKHIRSHSGERPFHCELCSKSFVDKYYVKQHLKTTHNVDEIKTQF